MPHEGIRRKVIEPDGRAVVLTHEAWFHITLGHPEMARYESEIMETITNPTDRTSDTRPGRERYFADGVGPSRFLGVVVDFNDDPGQGEVVTAFGHRNER